MGLCIIKSGPAEDPVLAAQRRGSEKQWTCLQERGLGGGEGRRALERETKTQREMDRAMKRDRQKQARGERDTGGEVRV